MSYPMQRPHAREFAHYGFLANKSVILTDSLRVALDFGDKRMLQKEPILFVDLISSFSRVDYWTNNLGLLWAQRQFARITIREQPLLRVSHMHLIH